MSSQATKKFQAELDELEKQINEWTLFGVVICHPDRPLRFGAISAETPENAIESALIIFEYSENLAASEQHITCIVPFGLGGDAEAIERDAQWGDMMSVHTNGKRMDPPQSIDDLVSSETQ